MNPDPIFELEAALGRGGLEEGLRFLNGRVAHRFSAVYRLEDQMLHNVQLVDKVDDGFDRTALASLPLGDSFCQFVMRDGFFRASKISEVDELEGHPYKGVLESYVGLPLMKHPGELYGTLCHFDFGEKALSDEEFGYLQKVARLLPRFL
ncbi:MAG: GAF domain-containing protein [Comamonadaceae bacterium]|nr:MAG: GAF domain-containing protein [Comamonadaceae bacterium]